MRRSVMDSISLLLLHTLWSLETSKDVGAGNCTDIDPECRFSSISWQCSKRLFESRSASRNVLWLFCINLRIDGPCNARGSRPSESNCRIAFRGVRVGSKLVESVTKGILCSEHVSRSADFGKERRGRQRTTPPEENFTAFPASEP